MRFILVLFAAFVSFSGLAQAKPGFDINDVAVLFPNDAKHQPIPYIDLSTATLIDNGLFQGIIKKSNEFGIKAPQTSKVDNATDWSIRGFRVDPCAPEDHGVSTETCVFELRLIAQPIARFSPADSAIHLIYRLGTGKPSADNLMLQDLLHLKAAAEKLAGASTNGEALGVHPLLAAATKGKQTALPELFKTFVLKHAQKKSLSKITMMGLRNSMPNSWIFFGGNIHNDGRWTLELVPNRTSTIQGPANFVELDLSTNSSPFKGQAKDANLAMDQFFNQIEEFSPADLETFATRALTLENPTLSDRNTSDCVSCHTATTARFSTQWEMPKDLPGVTFKDPAGITAFPALGAVPNHPLHWNLRAFGYFGLQPTVSMRTVHEAAASAAELNTILGLENPGLDCGTRAVEVLQCLVKGTIEPGTVQTTRECLAKCSPSTR